MEKGKMHSLRSAVVVLSFVVATNAFGVEARRDWTKVELTSTDGTAVAIRPEVLARFGAKLIADYGTHAVVYAPKRNVEALKAAAAEGSVRLRARDDMEVLHLPGASLDVREGVVGVAPHALTREYPPGAHGLYVLQFAAAPQQEWVAELTALGWQVSRYIPTNGYLVVGKPELLAKTRQLAFVQWLDVFHPYQKWALIPKGEASHDFIFELPAGPAAAAAIEAIRAAAEGSVEVSRLSTDTFVYARMSSRAARVLVRHELVLSISAGRPGELSDGRQVLSLTDSLSTDGARPVKTDYWSWVLNRCPECNDMPSAIWRIGIADSGVDNGMNAGGHPDLEGRKSFGIRRYGPGNNDWLCPPYPDGTQNLDCDQHQHGTLVAGIAAGNGGTHAVDVGTFPIGVGGAPTAGIFSTKTLTRKLGGPNPFNGNFEAWAKDAADNAVTIQNHSWQASDDQPQWPDPEVEDQNYAGRYTWLSRLYDIHTRDANGVRTPLLFSVASGNLRVRDVMVVSHNAMAKNVLTVGGLENYRPERNGWPNCSADLADSFRNIMQMSRVGTRLDGYIKPDVMAPASLILSTQTSVHWPPQSPMPPYCLQSSEGDVRYSGATGTSFAAPLGSAAALVVKRYLGNAPADRSPALVRAMLIAGARSVRGGEDRTKTPVQPIGPVPSQQQGFGRLTLEDILSGANKPLYFDQVPSQTFTATGQTRQWRLRVRDASKPVKIALVWTDTPGTAMVPNPLVNDLNLEVRRNCSTTHRYVGNKLAVTNEASGEESVAYPLSAPLPYDAINNVEYFRSYMTANEQFEVFVKARDIRGDTDGNTANFEQDFAIAFLNADLAPADNPPAASFTINCTELTCSANSTSTDDHGVVSYRWNWGDGRSSTGGPGAMHTYSSNGSYPVTLTVTDGACQSATSAAQTVTVMRSRNAEFVNLSVPEKMIAGYSYDVSVTLKNIGTVAWSPVGAACNAYRFGSKNGIAWGTTGRIDLSAPVAVGQEVTLKFKVVAPATPGVHPFEWGMLQECVEWFQSPVPVVSVTVRAPAAKDAYVVRAVVPSRMIAGYSYPVIVTLKNAGSTAWNPVAPACNAYRFGVIGDNNWGVPAGRVNLTDPVPPGGEVTLRFNARAPLTPGSYPFAWQMLQECVEWFGDPTPAMSVTVRAPEAKEAYLVGSKVPEIMVAGQSYPVSITMKNLGGGAWSPVGPACNAYRLGSSNAISWGVPGGRVELAAAVAQQATVTLNFTVKAPSTPGTYLFEWGMVQECMAWFGDVTTLMPVKVNAP